MLMRLGFWKDRLYKLDRMTLRELVGAYFTYYAVVGYLVAAGLAFVVLAATVKSPWPPLAAAGVAILVYPLAWYLLHRFVLHGRYLYRSPWTSSVWKRIHFDHHQDPSDLRVLFGALYTTLPTIALVTIPLGWVIGGLPGGAAGFAAGLLTTCVYEFCHCIQHLNFQPRWSYLQRIKRLHLSHHFHNENGNYGITSFFWDHRLRTYYAEARDIPRSPTVFNLGYTEAESELYPWVAARSNGRRSDSHPRHFRASEADGPGA